MEIRVRLVHVDGNLRIVHVSGFEGDRCVGSALGEAATAEEAEERALYRLRHRLQLPGQEELRPPHHHSLLPHSLASPPPPLSPPSPEEPPKPPPLNPLQTSPTDGPLTGSEEPEDPEDWSADLAQLDLLLRQLGWGKEQERVFLERLFGHPSRSRLTRYEDLQLLRKALEGLPPHAQPGNAPLPLRRSDLLSQCDGLLQRLGWTTERARQVLEHNFSATSRQHLSDEQLLTFNLLLEGELLSPPSPVDSHPQA